MKKVIWVGVGGGGRSGGERARREEGLTGLERFVGQLIRAEAGEQLADDGEGQARDDLAADGAVREHLLGHHQQVCGGPQLGEQQVPTWAKGTILILTDSMCKWGWRVGRAEVDWAVGDAISTGQVIDWNGICPTEQSLASML